MPFTQGNPSSNLAQNGDKGQETEVGFRAAGKEPRVKDEEGKDVTQAAAAKPAALQKVKRHCCYAPPAISTVGNALAPLF